MEISVSGDINRLTDRIIGRVDTIAAGEFQRRLEETLNSGVGLMILDMEKMDYISSAGLRSVLILCKKAQNTKTRLVCCSMNKVVRKIFDVSGFSKIVSVVDTINEVES